MFKATVQIQLRPSILDPQGKATQHALAELGHQSIDEVRIGKMIHLSVNTNSHKEAEATVTSACEKLLANMVMEDYSFTLEEVTPA